MASYDPERHHRRSVRLRGYDYAQGGLYFLTICAHEKACIFGDVSDGQVHLSEVGQIVVEEWERTAELRPNVVLDSFVAMPNHVHGLIALVDVKVTGLMVPIGAAHPTASTPRGPIAGSISAIIGQFKAVTTKRINMLRDTPGAAVWQRSFYDYIVRHERALEKIRAYITDNPATWETDQLHPDAPPDS